MGFVAKDDVFMVVEARVNDQDQVGKAAGGRGVGLPCVGVGGAAAAAVLPAMRPPRAGAKLQRVLGPAAAACRRRPQAASGAAATVV